MQPAPPPVSPGDGTLSEQQRRRPQSDLHRPGDWGSDGQSQDGNGSWSASAQGTSRWSGLPWAEFVAFAGLLAAIVVPLVFLGGASQPTAGSAPSPLPGVIPRTAFQFDPPTLRISALGRNKATAATDAAAESIRTSLSTFYDQAFVDPT